MPSNNKKIIEKIPDFDILYQDALKGAIFIKNKLEINGFKNVKLIKHLAIGEVIPFHYEIRVRKETIAFIYEQFACHSYNTITIKGVKINVATIETILYFYFSFYYSNQPYYYKDRIMCMIKILFDVQQENRLEQKGLLKRFTSSCIGKQNTLQDIRRKKTEKFSELYMKKGTQEYLVWFLKYNPAQNDEKKILIKNLKIKKPYNKSYDNKSYDNKSYDNKSYNNKSYNNKSYNNKPYNTPYNNKPYNNKPYNKTYKLKKNIKNNNSYERSTNIFAW